MYYQSRNAEAIFSSDGRFIGTIFAQEQGKVRYWAHSAKTNNLSLMNNKQSAIEHLLELA